MSTYDDYLKARRLTNSLLDTISNCDHVFAYAAQETTTVAGPSYDYWAGPGYGTSKTYAVKQSRVCRICGLKQTKMQSNPDVEARWLAD